VAAEVGDHATSGIVCQLQVEVNEEKRRTVDLRCKEIHGANVLRYVFSVMAIVVVLISLTQLYLTALEPLTK
jgi:hypothetical protein